jgi:hypothetical protein
MNKDNNTTPSDFPKELPIVSNPPEGFHWEYRGKNWLAKNVVYACHGLYNALSVF